MQFDESIYNLIPKEQFVPEKGARYKSQYPANLAPTASTFGLGTTSKTGASNLSGKFNLEGGKHSHLAGGATMGAPKGALKPQTTGFRKKGTGQPTLVAKTEGKSSVTLEYGRWRSSLQGEALNHGVSLDVFDAYSNSRTPLYSVTLIHLCSVKDYQS